MNPLMKLQNQRQKHIDELDKLIKQAEAEDRGFTAEEAETCDGLFASVEDVDKRIKNITRTDELRSAADNSPAPRITRDGPGDAEWRERPVNVEVRAPRLADDPTGGYGTPVDLRTLDFRRRDHREQAIHGFGQFALDVRRSRSGASERLLKWDAALRAAGDGMQAVIGHEGAYLLPSQYGALLETIVLENAVVRPRATPIPMNQLTIEWPTVDDTSHSSGTVFGGIQAYWASEEEQITSSKPKLGTTSLTLHRLTALAYATNTMLDWSPVSIESWLPLKLAQAIAWKEDDKFIAGTGAGGEPIGLLNSACATQISKEGGQAAATLVFENVINMDARLWGPMTRANCYWIANRTCKKQLPKMTIDVGTGGSAVFLPANMAASQPLETLYGYPIVFTEHAQALGTAGDFMLVNGSEYLVADATGRTRTDRDMGLKFDYDQTAFRVVTYTGGMCPWRSAFTPQNGDSLSPILYLQART